MKRILNITVILCSLILTSCFNPVYYEIRKDVKPEAGTISGNILQITRTTVDNQEFLVLYANEGIRYKLGNAKIMVEIELQQDEIIKLNLKKKIAELLDGGANK